MVTLEPTQLKLSSEAIRYQRAWKTVYRSLPDWKKKEIDMAIENGKLPNSDWSNSFARQVADLAEKSEPQSV
jgi:hypothetical protein